MQRAAQWAAVKDKVLRGLNLDLGPDGTDSVLRLRGLTLWRLQ